MLTSLDSSLGKVDGFDSEAAHERVSTIRKLLAQWLENLPVQLQRENLSPEIKSFRGAVHLHMNHLQITVYMGRRALLKHIHLHLKDRKRNDRHGNGPSPSDSNVSTMTSATDHSTFLMRRCVDAAYRIIDLIKFLSDNDRLARFSFTDLNCCSSAAIIIMTHEIIQHHPMYQSAMDTALRAMGFMATGCQNAKRGFKLIKHLQSVIANLRTENVQRRATETDSSQSAEYDAWRQWMGINENDPSASAIDTGPGMEAPSFNAQLPINPPGAIDFTSSDDFNFAIWPDNLDALGLSGFEDFEFPTGRNTLG